MNPDIWIENVKQELVNRNMGAAALAHLSGISEASLSRWFSHERQPNHESRRKVEVALGMLGPAREDPNELLRRAVFTHPDLGEDGAEHVWRYAGSIIEGGRKRKG
ncbi:MAG: helix-turn-helix domain-containing protein [Chloroflexi bacterium]|nr:helix-turn-helix domain-containing protein [Chloroflexota bacterium]